MAHHSGNHQTSMLLKRSKAALALGVILGSASLFGGQAKAASTSLSCFFNSGTGGSIPPNPVPACNNILTDPTLGAISPNQFKLGDKLFSFIGITSPSNAPGHVAFTWNDPDGGVTTYGDDTWSVSTIFDSPISNESGFIDYTLEVVAPGITGGWLFNGVKLDSLVPSADGVVVNKYINNTSTPYLTSTIGSSDPTIGFAPLGGTFITVRDGWTVAPTSQLSNMVNTYTQGTDIPPAPGPLPLFGAGAAFGFSRRIRRRIKGARLA